MNNENYLIHYGVKGMKWGVRRYQNKDGSLTAEGTKRALREYAMDNSLAYERGRKATIYGNAAAKSTKRTIKIENKLDKQYAKDPEGSKAKTQKLRKKWEASAKTTAELLKTYNESKDIAEKHCKELVNKYGKEAVSTIKYKDVKLPKGEYSPTSFKTMNEKTNNASDYAKAGARTVATSMITSMMGMPITMIYYPTSTGQKAANVERTVYRSNLESSKNKR